MHAIIKSTFISRHPADITYSLRFSFQCIDWLHCRNSFYLTVVQRYLVYFLWTTFAFNFPPKFIRNSCTYTSAKKRFK